MTLFESDSEWNELENNYETEAVEEVVEEKVVEDEAASTRAALSTPNTTGFREVYDEESNEMIQIPFELVNEWEEVYETTLSPTELLSEWKTYSETNTYTPYKGADEEVTEEELMAMVE